MDFLCFQKVMASTSTSALSLSPSPALVDGKAPAPRQSAVPTTQCVGGIPTLTPPSLHSANGSWKSTAYGRKAARNNVMAMATGDASAELVAGTIEVPEILKTAKEAWNKVDDKYAVSSLAVAGGIALCALAGMLSAVERLPLIPGALEVVGIGYTGWFAYKNLFYEPDREALIRKIKEIYSDII